jgi:hypothetical protein
MIFARRIRPFILFLMVCYSAILAGCEVLPERTYVPTLHNPFPQLTEVAVIPFINKTTDNPMVDGREFAEAYSEELQKVPGFHVVAVSTVERAMLDLNLLAFGGPEDLRRLANYLQVDAIVIGTVNRYDGFYPPEIGMEVEWYAANPYMHPIPPGYGLPWGTPAEEQIPSSVVFESELALAREQMKTQMPEAPIPDSPRATAGNPNDAPTETDSSTTSLWQQSGEEYPRSDYQKMQDRTFLDTIAKAKGSSIPPVDPMQNKPTEQAYRRSALSPNNPEYTPRPRRDLGETASDSSDGQTSEDQQDTDQGQGSRSETASLPGLPEQWPDPRGFIPDGPVTERPEGVLSNAPVLRHVAVYNGNDTKVTEALKTYYLTQIDDARIEGWQNLLQRREEFISFCCRLHIWEMLSSRGGAGDAIKLTRKPKLWRGGQPIQ